MTARVGGTQIRRWLSALAIGVAGLGLACQEPAGVAEGPLASVSTVANGPANRKAVQAVAGAVKCQPIAADSVTQRVGEKGGTIQVGPHTLWIPAEALDDPVLITAVAPSDTVNRIRFRPEGLTFRKTAKLTMSYGNCDVQNGSKEKLEVAYLNDALQILEYLNSRVDVRTSTVQGDLHHFSNYAVAF
jgi:hypothetical protein